MTSITSLCEMACQVVQKKLEEKQLEEERAAKAKYWKLPVCYDDDDDEERSDFLDDNIIYRLPSFSAITPNEPVLSTEVPDNSLSMGDEHLDTIPAMESNEFIKSSVENLIPIPCESEGIPEHMCDVPFHDNSPPLDISKDQFEDISESNEEFSSTGDDSFSLDNIDYLRHHLPTLSSSALSDDQSCSDEDVLEKIVSKPLSQEEIIPMESLRTHDSSLPISSKIDSLLDESADELTLLKSIPPGINETDCSSCGALYTRDCVCSIRNVEDKILVPKPLKNCARCTRCGYLVDGPNCNGCALVRQELEENLVTHSPDFQNSSEPSNASTNVVNAPRESYVVKQDNGSFVDKIIFDLNRAPDSPNQFHCFHCKDVLRDEEACKRRTYAKCGSCLEQMPSFDSIVRAFASLGHDLGNSYVYDPNSNSFDCPPDSYHPPHPTYETYSYDSYGNDSQFGYDCQPQFPLTHESEPGYNENYTSYPYDSLSVPQQYPCCARCGGPHET
nr:hypothetical protein [Tanacetum cinerariifolium]